MLLKFRCASLLFPFLSPPFVETRLGFSEVFRLDFLCAPRRHLEGPSKVVYRDAKGDLDDPKREDVHSDIAAVESYSSHIMKYGITSLEKLRLWEESFAESSFGISGLVKYFSPLGDLV